MAQRSSVRSVNQAELLADVGEYDAQRVERVIAVARGLLATVAIIIVRLDPTEPARYMELTYSLLGAYGAFAIFLMILLLRRTPIHAPVALVIHTADVAFAAALTLFSAGPNSPLFVYLLYPLLAAAYRWRFRQVMLTAIVVDALIALEAFLINSKGIQGRIDLNTFVMRMIYVIVAGAIVGYLAENEKRRRSEAVAVSLILTQAQSGAVLAETLDVVLGSLCAAFHASQSLLVVWEQQVGRAFLWSSRSASRAGNSSTPPADASQRSSAALDELPRDRRADYLFDTPGTAWHGVMKRVVHRGRFNVVSVDSAGRLLPSAELKLPDGFSAAHPCRRLLCVSLPFSDEWIGRLFILNPAVGVHRVENARFALRLASQVGPSVYGHYLVHRLRMRAQSAERGRIARELHDGITQSLLGLEMQVAVLRRRALAEAPQLDEDLARLHGVLRNEVVTLRELMEGIRAGDVESGSLLDNLGEMVERFRRYTGIGAQFSSDQKDVPLTPHVRREVARIVHEALVNIRKHSGARRVLVRAGMDNGCWKLSIEDDGRGFPFVGRRSQTELDELRQGPRTIGQRVRILGGDMVVESRPGFGARVEVAIPLPV